MAQPTLQDIKLARQKLAFQRDKTRLQLDEKKLRAAEAEEAEVGEEGYEPSLSALARRFGISRETFRKFIHEPDAPQRKARRGYRVKDWGAWLLKQRTITDAERTERSARVRFILANAEGKELANAEKAKRIMTIDEHNGEIRAMTKCVREGLERFRSRVAMVSSDKAWLKAAEDVAREVLHEMANHKWE